MQMRSVHYLIINFIFTIIVMIELILLDGRVAPSIFITQYSAMEYQLEEDCSKGILKIKQKQSNFATKVL